MTEFRIEFPEGKYLSVKVSPRFYRENELSDFVAVFHGIIRSKNWNKSERTL